MYSATTFIASNSCGTVQPVVSIERTVFYREKASGMYSPLPYAFAQASMLWFLLIYMRPFDWASEMIFNLLALPTTKAIKDIIVFRFIIRV